MLEMRFLEWKVSYIDLNFTEVCSYMCSCQYVTISSGDDLVPTRHQVITWTNGEYQQAEAVSLLVQLSRAPFTDIDYL